MHTCFNNLEICPGLESQVDNRAEAVSICLETTSYLKKFRQGFRLGKLKSSKEFD